MILQIKETSSRVAILKLNFEEIVKRRVQGKYPYATRIDKRLRVVDEIVKECEPVDGFDRRYVVRDYFDFALKMNPERIFCGGRWYNTIPVTIPNKITIVEAQP